MSKAVDSGTKTIIVLSAWECGTERNGTLGIGCRWIGVKGWIWSLSESVCGHTIENDPSNLGSKMKGCVNSSGNDRPWHQNECEQSYLASNITSSSGLACSDIAAS